MAFTFGESFQQFTVGAHSAAGGLLSQYPNASAQTSIEAALGRWDTKNLKVDTGTLQVYTSNPAATAGSTNYARRSNNPTNAGNPIAQVMMGTTSQFTVGVTATGFVEVKRGGSLNNHSGTLIATSAVGGLLQANIYHFIEVIFEISATVGKVQVYIDGNLVIDVTGVNNRGHASLTTWDSVVASAPGSTQNRFSDWFCTDTFERVGERRFETLRPASNGAAQDFVANTGVAFDAVNDLSSDGDTTYISASVVGNRSTFNLDDLPVNPTSVDMVIARQFARKDDAATRGVKLALGDGTNLIYGPEKFLTASYVHYNSLFNTAPDGGAWTTAKVNALLAGVEVGT